jgi:hypothetical protein
MASRRRVFDEATAEMFSAVRRKKVRMRVKFDDAPQFGRRRLSVHALLTG